MLQSPCRNMIVVIHKPHRIDNSCYARSAHIYFRRPPRWKKWGSSLARELGEVDYPGVISCLGATTISVSAVDHNSMSRRFPFVE